MSYLRRLWAWTKPEVRNWLDAFGAFLAITLFFCLIQAAHDGVANRNRSLVVPDLQVAWQRRRTETGHSREKLRLRICETRQQTE